MPKLQPIITLRNSDSRIKSTDVEVSLSVEETSVLKLERSAIFVKWKCLAKFLCDVLWYVYVIPWE